MDGPDDVFDEPKPDTDRSQAIARVIEQVRSARAGGEQISDPLVISAHSEMMPELGRELDKLRRIEAAWAAAASPALDPIAAEEALPVGEAELELARALSADLQRPTIEVPGYTVLREIGRGGQAVVFLAVKRNFDKRLALKVMRDGSLADDSTIARFKREAGMLAKLYHPNIVTIFETGRTADGSHYFTMDYIAGCSLGDYMQRGETSDPDDPSRLLRLFIQICDAVNAAHVLGIVHRDLKPANIRVDESGEPHILDFGLARTALHGATGGEPVSITGDFLGSLPWASPEQAAGDYKKIDVRTDVYSLGVILYQMLTGGHFPYEVVGNVRDVLNNIVTIQPTPPSKIGGAAVARDVGAAPTMGRTYPLAVNDEIEKIVLKALAKHPDQRYPNAGELSRAIADYLLGRQTTASAGARLQRQSSRAVSRRRAIVVAAIIATAVGGGIIRQKYPQEGDRMKPSNLLKSLVLLVTASAIAGPHAAPHAAPAHRAPLAHHLARADAHVRALNHHLMAAAERKVAHEKNTRLADRARKLSHHHHKEPRPWGEFVWGVPDVIVADDGSYPPGPELDAERAAAKHDLAQIRQVEQAADLEAEKAVAVFGDDLDAMWARRMQVEAERMVLWSKIAFRAVADMELSNQALYRFELKSAGKPLDEQRMEALKAAAQFVRVVDHLASQAQEAVDVNPHAVYAQWHTLVATARAQMQDKLLSLGLVAMDVYKPDTDAGQLAADAKQLADLAQSIVDAEHALAAAEKADDDEDADASRAELQDALTGTATAVVALDKSIGKTAADWGIAGIPGTRAVIGELPDLAPSPPVTVATGGAMGLDERLKEGESYTGTSAFEDGIPMLQITERNGKAVRAIWTWKKKENDQTFAVIGIVTREELSLESADSRIVIGGMLRGDRLQLKYNGPKLSTMVEFIVPRGVLSEPGINVRKPTFPPNGKFAITYSPGNKHTVVSITNMSIQRRGDHGEFATYTFRREGNGSLSLSHSAGYEIWRVGPDGDIVIDRWEKEADCGKPAPLHGRLEPTGESSQRSAASPSTPRSILERLAGTKWVNSNGRTFEWSASGTFFHSGKETACESMGPLSVRIDFGKGHFDVLTFDESLTRFKQISSAPDVHFTGTRTESK